MESKKLTRYCPICGCVTGKVIHTQYFQLSEGNPLPAICDYVVCDECGFAFSDTPVDQAGYDSYYAGMSKYADSATSTGAGVLPWDKARLEQLADHVAEFCTDREARIVDIGCANGGLLVALREKGFKNVCGIDPSPACVEVTRSLAKGDAWVGTLSAIAVEAGSFDGIILSHVMEHVRDLAEAMDLVHGLLNPGGWVYIEVPDAPRYHEFLVAPFQDFNTEHINHFSEASLANLCRRNRFVPELGGTKIIYSAEDMPYPALFWFARKSADSLQIVTDRALRGDLEKYITLSHDLMQRIDGNIARLIAEYPEIIIWGTGQLTMKLLSDTCLRTARISAFVDSNPINQGKMLHGANVIAGPEITAGNTPILVCSLINEASILDSIRTLGLPNPVATLLKGKA
ncbi:MAG: methyltransferase domain-containing protein [Proteobacteria bacterium]|nr:methyltransferase domain-containing protein [Pseudomonadota bacterium]